MGTVIKSQKTEAFWATSTGEVIKATAVSGIEGIEGAREAIDTSDLATGADGTCVAGVASPRPVTLSFNVKKGEVAHRALLKLRDSGDIVSWGIYSSDAATQPVAAGGILQPASGRVSIRFMGFVSNFSIRMQSNDLWRGTIQIQRSGGFDYDLQTAEEEILSMFGDGSQGAWFDPSDMSTLFQDAAGTTPVTTLEQPVGLMLDKSGRSNHASQAVAASRPVLSARVNLLTSSEAFSSVDWTKASGGVASAPVVTENFGAAPTGTQTADRLVFSINGGTASADISQLSTAASLSTNVGTRYTSSIYLRSNDGTTKAMSLVGVAGALQTISVTPVWQRFSTTEVASTTTSTPLRLRLRGAEGTSDSADVLAWGAQCEASVSVGPYQQVNTATDYNAVGFAKFLRFDGVNDWLQTGAMDFSSSSRITLVAGARKVSDAAVGVLCELSAVPVSNNGAFGLLAPGNVAPNVQFVLRGTTTASATNQVAPAPFPAVLTGIGDTGVVPILQTNGVPISGPVAPGGGMLGNYPLYIGRRGGTAFSFNGNLHGLIVLGRSATGAEISASEAFMASRTGVTL